MSNVDIANAAVSMPGCESVTFVASSHNVSGRVWRDGEESAGRGMTVPACSLRQITANHELDHFSLVCDIEGAEAEFILGDPEALAGCDQCIIECHNTTHLDRWVSVDELLEVLTNRLGFSLVDQRGRVCFLRRDTRQSVEDDPR